jgi:hypothetical protein
VAINEDGGLIYCIVRVSSGVNKFELIPIEPGGYRIFIVKLSLESPGAIAVQLSWDIFAAKIRTLGR